MIATTPGQVLLVAAVVAVALGATVLLGLITGIHHERRKQSEERLFRARMDAYYHRLPGAIVDHAYEQARQIRAAARGDHERSGR